LDSLPSISDLLSKRGIVDDIKSGAQSVGLEVGSALPTKVQSAIDSVSTPMLSWDHYIPRNLTVGSKQICVANDRSISCTNFPLNLSNLVDFSSLPDVLREKVKRTFQFVIDDLDPIAGPITLVARLIKICFVISIMLVTILTLLFLYLMACELPSVSLPSINGWASRVVYLLGGLSFISLAVPFIVFQVLRHKTSDLPSWVEVRLGSISGLCIGAWVCNGVMLIAFVSRKI
jgi:hypothetical protein